jgi:hypothetical protein
MGKIKGKSCAGAGARSEMGKSEKNFKGRKRCIYIKNRIAPLGESQVYYSSDCSA